MILAFVLTAFEHKNICIYKSVTKITKVVEPTDNFCNFVFKILALYFVKLICDDLKFIKQLLLYQFSAIDLKKLTLSYLLWVKSLELTLEQPIHA